MSDFGTVSIGKTKLGRKLILRNIKVLLTALITAIIGSFLFIVSYQDGKIIFIGLSVIILGLSLIGFFWFVTRSIRLFNHPDLKRFSKFQDSESLLKQFTYEYDHPAVRFTHGFYNFGYLTENFIIVESFYRIKWYLLTEIVWAYRKETKKSVNFVPTGTSYGVVINFRNGETVELNFEGFTPGFSGINGEVNADDFIITLARVAPFAYYGYSSQIAQAWARNRAALVAEVERRVNQI